MGIIPGDGGAFFLQRLIGYQKAAELTLSGRKFTAEEALNLGLILNTLPSEYYGREHIPNSYNLFYKTINKMSVEEVKEWISYVVENNYILLYLFINLYIVMKKNIYPNSSQKRY